jgi:predicted component of type VI protein secretion system
MKKYVSLLLFLLLALLSGCSTGPSGTTTPPKSAPSSQQQTLNLYSWADNFNPKSWQLLKKNITARLITMFCQ